jgi:hypothetical protein
LSLPFSSLRVAGGFVFLAGQGGFDADHKPVRTTVCADLVAGMHVEITIVAKQP